MVKNLRPLIEWHKELARYKNGKKLQSAGVNNGSEIGLFSLTYVKGEGVFYFVGSRTDYNKICGISDFGNLPLATNITAH